VADGVVIPLDVDDTRAKAKVQNLKREAAQAGKAYGQAGAQAARVGGAGGGLLARGLGGFNQGWQAGAVGLGLTAAGVGLNAFMARDAERVSLAKAREARAQERDAQARTVMERRDQLAAGGVSFLGAARRIVSRGIGQSEINAARSTGRRYGLSTEQQLESIEVSQTTGVSNLEIQQAIATGFWSSAEGAAKDIQRFNGLQNAIAATQSMTNEQASAAIDRTLTSRVGKNLARAGSAMNPVAEAQMAALTSGETADALSRQANDQLNPGARLAAEAAQKAMDTVNQLRAAADAQSTMAALLSEMGRVVGVSEGSASRQLAVAGAAASE
jgi:hypothetical protein